MTTPSPRPVPVKVLYILGMQRGGTTVAGRLLGQVPGFVFVGELRRLIQLGLPERCVCGCGREYDACPVWSRVIRDVFRTTSPAEARTLQQAAAPERDSLLRTARLARHGRLDRTTRGYCGVASDLYLALARATGARVVVDSSKSASDAALLGHMADIDPFVLHLIRDPRATAFSRIVRGGRPDARAHPWQALIGGGAWLKRNVSARLLHRAAPQRYLRARYEDMVDDPNRFVEAVAHLVGEPPPQPPMVTGGVFAAAAAHTPTGQGRFGPDAIHLVPDERWRTGLRAADRMLISGLCAPLAARYGYGRRIAGSDDSGGGVRRPRSSR